MTRGPSLSRPSFSRSSRSTPRRRRCTPNPTSPATPVRLGSGAPARIVAGSGRRTRRRRWLPSPRLPPVTSRRTLEVLGALLLLFIARTDVGSAELIFSGATANRCSAPAHGLPRSPNSTLRPQDVLEPAQLHEQGAVEVQAPDVEPS